MRDYAIEILERERLEEGRKLRRGGCASSDGNFDRQVRCNIISLENAIRELQRGSHEEAGK